MKKVITYVLISTMIMSLVGCGNGGTDNSAGISEPTAVPGEDVQGEKDDSIVNSAEVTFTKVSEERFNVEMDASDAINLYLVARVHLDRFLQYDISSGNAEEYAKLLDLTIEAFENAGVAAKMLQESAGSLELLEASVNYIATNGECRYMIGNNISKTRNGFPDLRPFVYTVYAADDSEAVKWAKDITERFDKAPVGKGIRTLAEQMGTDAKHAYAQLKQAQDILAGDAYGDFAKTADAAYKTAKVLKTAGTAAQLTLSIVTADPVTTTEAVMASGGILINGMNTILEVGQTGSVLFVGDDNKLSQTLENIEDSLAPIGSAIGLYGLGSNLAKGAELLDDVPAMADSAMYIGSSLYDYIADGKILGGSFKQAADGTITCEIVDTMTFKSAWAKEPEAAKELLEKVGYSEEEINKVIEKAEEGSTVETSMNDPLADIPSEILEKILEEVSPVINDNFILSEEAADLFKEFEAEAEEIATATTEDGVESSDAESVEGENETDNENSGDTEALNTEASDKEVSDKETSDKETSDKEVPEKQTENTTANEEVADNSIPSIGEIPGYYPFYAYMTLGDQSADGEVPQTIKSNGGNSLTMTDVDGYSINGTYDATSGVAKFPDSDGLLVKVTFSYKGGKVHAELRMNTEGASMSGSADKH